jgi:hypothetical protein
MAARATGGVVVSQASELREVARRLLRLADGCEEVELTRRYVMSQIDQDSVEADVEAFDRCVGRSRG